MNLINVMSHFLVDATKGRDKGFGIFFVLLNAYKNRLSFYTQN